jgi:hypothetical protein
VKYLLLLYASDDRLWELTGCEQQALWSSMGDLGAMDERIRLFLLESTGAALTLRRRSDGLLLGGGSGVDAEEQLQGCMVLEAANLDAAIQMASRLPMAAIGSVEVRPARDRNQA